jgi:hypothetical protein
MLITAREASRRLQERAGVGRQQSRRVLLAGLAGAGVRTGGVLLYDAERVAGVAGWPAVEHTVLLAESPCGVFVARLGPGREVSALATWEQSAAAVRVQADLGFPAWAQAKALLGVGGRLPFVASVCGFPVLLADLVSLRGGFGRDLELGLEPAGPWRHLLDQRRLVTAPGPPWLLLGHQPYLGRAQRARDRGEPVGAGRESTWTRWA